MRADEARPGERIRHPQLGDVVIVDHVTVHLNHAKVHFRTRGEHGWFSVPPHAELEDCT
jgi:hypothetical protein